MRGGREGEIRMEKGRKGEQKKRKGDAIVEKGASCDRQALHKIKHLSA